MRIGIYGGVFNPPHVGHLICAQEAIDQLGLAQVVLMPVGEAPHRDLEHEPGAEVRLRMCELATAGDQRLAVSRMELDRPGPSYTADTLRALAEHRPDDELVLLLGADQALRLPEWHAPGEVLALATVAVVERSDVRRADVEAALEGVEGGDRLVFFDMPRVDVSSSLVRRRAAAARPIRYLVPDKVAHFVGAQSLYGTSTPAAVG